MRQKTSCQSVSNATTALLPGEDVGTRGPSKTPTKVLEMRGSWRADTRMDEPQPNTERPTCPAWLPAQAKSIWRVLIPQIEYMGILGTCDRIALARYCKLVCRWREAEDEGDVDKSIRVSIHLLKLEREFGLTPSARAGLAKPKENANENRGKARFFNVANARG